MKVSDSSQVKNHPTVSRDQLLHFIESKFDMADRDRDGELNISELGNFLRFITHPDLRAIKSWDKYRDGH